MRKWRLTLVTPTLNQASYIEDTIRSAKRQLTPVDRHIVVDGGSTDGTLELLEQIGDQVTAVHVRPGESQAEALRFGFAEYPAEFAAYLNSDDLLLPKAIDRALRTLAKPNGPVAVYGHRLFIDSANRLTRIWHLPPHSNYLMKRWDYIPQETCFWRYSAMMDSSEINPNLKFALDYDLFLRLMEKGRFVRLNHVMGAFRVHSKSKTSTLNETLGKQEVAFLQQRHKIRQYPWDRIVGPVLREWIAHQSRRNLNRYRDEYESRIADSITDPG